jgi:hypothetical protein
MLSGWAGKSEGLAISPNQKAYHENGRIRLLISFLKALTRQSIFMLLGKIRNLDNYT